MSEIAIKVENLTKIYPLYNRPRDRFKEALHPLRKKYHHDFYALDDVSFEIKKGETVGIIGQNGSGKSTLLKIITGVLTPSAGQVSVNGRISSLLELGTGFNPEMTGIENIYFNGTINGYTRKEMDERLEAILSFADIGEFVYQPVKSYSSGMFVRLAFAVAIQVEPDIMIVDEALAVGDMNFQAKCMTALTRIQEKGATVLFVSHDINSVKSLCTKGIYLDHGLVKKIGSAGDVAEEYIKSMREALNNEHFKVENIEKNKLPLRNAHDHSQPTNMINNQYTGVPFKTSSEFDKRVKQFRYGEGGARIAFVEMLDENFSPVNNIIFDQIVYIRIYFEGNDDAHISCNYYIMDSNRNLILGAGLRLLNEPLIPLKKGDKYIVTYKTRLPIQAGNYSIQIQLTAPVFSDNSAKFLDVIDNSVVFEVSQRENARIWTKVYIDNEVDITIC